MIEFNFTPFPVLQTERLTLRNVSVNDVNEIFELRSNPEVGRYIERNPHADKAETLAWIENIILKGLAENRSIQWAISLLTCRATFSEKHIITDILYFNIKQLTN